MHWSGNHADASLKEVTPVNINELNIDEQVSLGRGTSKNRSAAATPVFLPGESQGWEPGALPSMGSHRVGHD